MKNATDRSKVLARLLKTLPTAEPHPFPDADDATAVLIQSMLLWESTSAKAFAAYEAIRRHVLDFNELRVTMADEIVEVIGPRYPMATERAARLRAVLRSIFLREHAVSLKLLQEQGKRDARKYIESLDGIMPYASARVLLLSFQTHGIPVDGQLLRLLVEEEIVEPGSTEADAAAFLGRHVRAGDGAQVHAQFQHWVEERAGGGARAAKSGRATGGGARRSKGSRSRATGAASTTESPTGTGAGTRPGKSRAKD
ncbi:MAG: hypothetical protein KF817_15815 [Phycisphaeraceae bacterium]|nr:hypothetical protein [Phycisphaeraceae bacterium]